jgi:shikimate dehydrogenase
VTPTLTPTRRAAVLGSPVRHSLSPVLHRAAYAALDLPGWEYERIECDEAGLAAVVSGLGPEWAGLSLTMPLKRVALEVAGEIAPDAAAIGAANTLVLDGRPGGRAENTDAPGMADALREAGLGTPRAPVLLGAGGTAQAALAALRLLAGGVPVTVLVRTPERAAPLVATAARLGTPLVVGPLDDAVAVLPGADLIISTLPGAAADPLAGLLALGNPGAVLFDVVYDPWPTALAAAATTAGYRVLSGLDLLLHQAGHQVRLMTGRPAPLEAMRAALVAAR